VVSVNHDLSSRLSPAGSPHVTANAARDDVPFELITMGRAGVDIYPQQIGVGLAEVATFGKYLGGSPANVAVAAARLGRRAAVITRTGADPFGEFVHRALRGYGVDDGFVTPVAALPTPVTFCEIFPPDNFPLYFYRLPKAPDLEIWPEELDYAAIGAASVFWATVTGLSAEPSRAATLAALASRDGKHPTILDLDYRPMFWKSAAQARRWGTQAIASATVVVGNLDECEVAVGSRDPARIASALLDRGPQLAIVKLGPDGVLAADRDRQVRVPPVRVDVVNGLGAGDAFGGALCHGLLSGWDLAATITFANAAGAIVASRIACSDAMPTAAEVQSLLREDAHA
jgi:5-dehydro-2-deoxygluconokinase